MMVGNSLKSDVLPMIDAGGWGVHVPHGVEWELEKANPPQNTDRFSVLEDLSGLAGLVDQIA
jgi:putative hydrolase of the HAD superfamily